MSLFISVDGDVIKEIDLSLEFPNMSFPASIRQEDLPENIFKVEDMPFPSTTLNKITGYNIKNIAGKWQRVWTVEPLQSLELTAAYENQWASVRELRTERMKNIDWRYLRFYREERLGMTTTDNVAKLDEYMQALADITKQPNPFSISWPIEP